MDTKAETFNGHAAANKLLTREYRLQTVHGAGNQALELRETIKTRGRVLPRPFLCVELKLNYKRPHRHR